MTIRLVKPSIRRLLWSIVGTAVLSCIIAGAFLFIAALATGRNDSAPTSTGDYIRLFIWFVLLYGPSLLFIVWWISVPAIVGVGTLVAYVRRDRSQTVTGNNRHTT